MKFQKLLIYDCNVHVTEEIIYLIKVYIYTYIFIYFYNNK
jgi:hypothetical protein